MSGQPSGSENPSPPNRVTSPSVKAQTGLSTHNLIRSQTHEHQDTMNIPFLASPSSTKTDAPKDRTTIPLPTNQPPLLKQPIPQIPQPTYSPPTSSKNSLPSSALPETNPIPTTPNNPSSNLNSTVPTIPPPANYSPYPNMPDFTSQSYPYPYPYFPYPYPHPAYPVPPVQNPNNTPQPTPPFTPYTDTTPTPAARPNNPTTQSRQDLLDSTLADNRSRRLAFEDRKMTAATINAAVNSCRERD
ncbi:hypothetical protein PTTG_30246 [Puccinia triticina 1-1 BBBD Race 1]|uniref:Uncharacterized protein n=1 Tax=Puccinia triticina (isolate 1-1 / race 1 (BBBD)) TaxID=630390 RepID=A0A180FZI8_PUCT1|nr:hypothetical protein PTTG_30246 [Puccinia triticina 1-1 BBBD Race 1]